ncbi:type VI secretion system lipoprotein TssJ [Salinibius halmophilus]|uniref:type VI secretion system lipoprotein TssJ n=1 Tax=Salinibius halmophilus TaxID=1853216 RepID=UPI000E660C6D|nr:type VI secretion system lipoprotein TssJ [Salinibius halmophilus]
MRIFSTIFLLFTVLLTGCATPTLNFEMASAEKLNTDRWGDSYSVTMRVYQLSDTARFEEASYEALWKSDEATLGATLVSTREFIVEPNREEVFALERSAGAKFVAVAAFFRSHESNNWRAVKKINYDLPADTNLTLSLTDKTVELGYQ